MADNSKIEWTDATWNPVVGCSIVSAGCEHCYAERMAARLAPIGTISLYRDVAYCGRWTGRIEVAGLSVWAKPLQWQKPKVIFVTSMGDLFYACEQNLPQVVDRVLMTAAAAPRHQFVLLTKRPAVAEQYFMERITAFDTGHWPLQNVWIGATVENQEVFAERVTSLVNIGAMGWKIWVSFEPLLGPVNLEVARPLTTWSRFSGVVVGGESGPGARPIHPDWARGIRDHCAQTGTPFFFKQWGEWAPYDQLPELPDDHEWPSHKECPVYRVGKRRAGRLLDGREHNDLPWRMQAS